MKLPMPATLAINSTARSTFQANSKDSRSPVSMLGNIEGIIMSVKVWSLPALNIDATWK